MMYVDFEAGNKAYKLRLNTRNMIALEKVINSNPLSIFGDGETIPTITTMVAILHASLQQYHHGITVNDAFDVFDAWLADGHNAIDFVSIILDIYKTSGLVPNETEKTEELNEIEKN